MLGVVEKLLYTVDIHSPHLAQGSSGGGGTVVMHLLLAIVSREHIQDLAILIPILHVELQIIKHLLVKVRREKRVRVEVVERREQITLPRPNAEELHLLCTTGGGGVCPEIAAAVGCVEGEGGSHRHEAL